jgi:hypothetical protein
MRVVPHDQGRYGLPDFQTSYLPATTMPHQLRTIVPVAVVVAAFTANGCGTGRWSDSKRTATEQMLISDAVERAVMLIDMRPLAGQSVFLDTTILDDATDGKYMASALKHQLLASGCELAPEKDQATIVVEARAGAIGTDRNELLIGIPATTISVMGTGTSVPEIAAYKRTDQRGVAKVNLFAYQRTTGKPVWQSGLAQVKSKTRDRWVVGTGPFQDGDINDRVEFAGQRIAPPWNEHEAIAKTQAGEEAVAGADRTDLRRAKVFASLPPAGSPAADHPVMADERPVSLPPVR